MVNQTERAILDHLKGQQAPVTFEDLRTATGADVVALSVAVVALEATGRITSGDGEFPLYQLAAPVPLGYKRGGYVCRFCVRGCNECPPDDPEEAAVRY